MAVRPLSQKSIKEATRVYKEEFPKAFELLPARMNTSIACRCMLAIGFQESEFLTRVQYGGGPARSYFQFERGGGVAGVIRHESSRAHAQYVCEHLNVPFEARAVWRAMETNDVLGCAFTRLLLWTDPRPLPHSQHLAWETYLHNWRPGKPHPETWPRNWTAASEITAP